MTTTFTKTLGLAAAALMMTGAVATSASAKSRHHVRHGMVATERGFVAGPGRYANSYNSYNGGNAALQGNNGNSGQGDNSLGHIKGGNIGGGL